MASRSDQLHSHQFSLQRAVGALAMRDPDPVSSPMRRIGGALFASVMIAVLALAAAGVFGLLRPGTGGSWRDGRATIIEKETGARYVYLDGTLHPVLNYASAILILKTPDTVQVAREELVDIPRGTPIGIPGAPDPLPGPEQLVADPWTLCSRPATGQTGSSEPDTTESVLRVGWVPAEAQLGDDAMLAVDPTGGWHLLWNSRRFTLSDPALVLAALSWPEASATPVSVPVLNAIPAGPDIGPVQTARSDEPSAVPGLDVGEVFVVTNAEGNRQYGVALDGGVSAVTAVQASLLVVDGANGGDDLRSVSPADHAAAYRLPDLIPDGDDAPPPTTPVLAQPDEQGGVCATFASDTESPTLTVVNALSPVHGEVATGPDPAGVAQRADYVAVPPGRGVVVESLASPGGGGSLAVVSDLGLRFAVPSVEVLSNLGYGSVTPQRLPASLVSLVPAGRALDPDAAAMPVIPDV